MSRQLADGKELKFSRFLKWKWKMSTPQMKTIFVLLSFLSTIIGGSGISLQQSDQTIDFYSPLSAGIPISLALLFIGFEFSKSKTQNELAPFLISRKRIFILDCIMIFAYGIMFTLMLIFLPYVQMTIAFIIDSSPVVFADTIFSAPLIVLKNSAEILLIISSIMFATYSIGILYRANQLAMVMGLLLLILYVSLMSKIDSISFENKILIWSSILLVIMIPLSYFTQRKWGGQQ